MEAGKTGARTKESAQRSSRLSPLEIFFVRMSILAASHFQNPGAGQRLEEERRQYFFCPLVYLSCRNTGFCALTVVLIEPNHGNFTIDVQIRKRCNTTSFPQTAPVTRARTATIYCGKANFRLENDIIGISSSIPLVWWFSCTSHLFRLLLSFTAWINKYQGM